MTDSLFGPFKPGQPGKQDCSDGVARGKPSGNFSYIQKSSNNDPTAPMPNPYSKPQCTPWYHSTAQIDQIQVNTNLTGATAQFSGTVTAPTFQGNINVQSWKGFDIEHPKKENHRLRHICVEGPEAAVYIRGRCKDTSIINLPDYWEGLVDVDEISVNLTPFGSSQNLYVEEIRWGKQVIIKNADGGPVNCYYHVWAPRLGELHVEYEGKTASDYPGDQGEHSICGYHYDRRD